ncbi:DUF2087 domain-containing protein [Curtobacterium sp. 9128]|uniref:DUF2087 domain-containing protein n=1 Tax=Curtobacterium sp. 9128 TaxID=1793722 RepID=UPI001642AB12|nr:DUF2087 domain-containing protein [Curtobacterium sp. 9128]
MDFQLALRRARQVVAATMHPGMLRESAGLDWVEDDGTVDVERLGATRDALELLLSDQAVLHVGRVRSLPLDATRRRLLSEAIVRTAFARLDARGAVGEATLNAALAMFVEDVAVVRRDAVDDGVLTRSSDGSAYRLVE